MHVQLLARYLLYSQQGCHSVALKYCSFIVAPSAGNLATRRVKIAKRPTTALHRALTSSRIACRFGIRDMPELPETLPFTPLGDFIGEVGKPPTRTAMHTYLMRLREQGFDVSATVRKAVACGVRLDKEVRRSA